MKYQDEQLTETKTKMGNRDVVINDKTKVPLFTMLTCIGIVVGAAIWLKDSLHDINNEQKDIKVELRDIKRELAETKQEMTKRLSHDTMDNWIIRLKYENPNIKVPELR